MVKVVGYARVSSKSQADNTSLPEQERQVREYCSAMGYELMGFFADVKSGRNTDRPGWGRAMEVLELSECSGIVSTKLDRLGRNTIDLLQLGELARDLNKSILIPGISIDLESSSGRMIFRMLSSQCEFDCDIVNERFQSGREAKRRDGGNIGGAPAFGKKASDKKRESYIDNPEEQEIIEIIRRHRRSGKSFNAIAGYLNKKGFPTKRGNVAIKDGEGKMKGGWTHVHVKRILERIAA
jgi:DNA invertase Pin-like site-specific DNA recombinase